MLRTLALLIFVPIVAALLWLAAGTHATRADFVMAAEEPRTLDPQRVSWLTEIQLASAMFEGLTRCDPATLQPRPAGAVSWDVNEHRTVYTFRLRPTATWSNGAPVTAEDFRFSWLRALDPRTQSQYAALLFVMRGAEDYYRSRLNRDNEDDSPTETVGIRVPDALTLEITLSRPCSYFLDLTSFPTLAAVYAAAIGGGDNPPGSEFDSVNPRHDWVRPGRIVCNGAFVLKEWAFKNRILLERNSHYWDNTATGLDTVEVVISSDPNTWLMGYETGRIDLVRNVPTAMARVLQSEQAAGRRTDLFVGDRFSTYFFRVNCKRWPLSNADFRKALSLAIDRAAIAGQVMGLGETPAETYVPRSALRLMGREATHGQSDEATTGKDNESVNSHSSVTYQPPEGLGAGLAETKRVEMAREFLRKSGFLDDRRSAGRAIELAYSPNPDQQRVAEAVQAMWERNLGIKVELRSTEGKVLSTRIRDLDYDVVRSDWYGDYLDPGTFLDMFATENGQNRTGWSNAEYDRLIAAAAVEAVNARRFALFSEAERILCEAELPIIPLYFKRGNYLLNPRFEGLTDNIRDVVSIQAIRRLDHR